MTYRIPISVVSFLFVYLPSKSGFVIPKRFVIPYSILAWAISSNSSSCSEIVTEHSRPFINLTQTLVKIQAAKASRHFCRNWLLPGLPPPSEQSLWHLPLHVEQGPHISCNFILMCCFLSWHISSLWYLSMPREQALKPLLIMQRKEVMIRHLLVFPQPLLTVVLLSLPSICKLLGQEI